MIAPATRAAFTLIELLIVVAIIAILAAIAVPNFLEAQTRSKISRVKSDMRTAATAMESYAVDTNHYPSHYIVGQGRTIAYDSFRVLPRLTTPVAYLSSIEALRDTFASNRLVANADDLPGAGAVYEQDALYYQNYESTSLDLGDSNYKNYRAWGLGSVGADAVYEATTWRMYNVILGAWTVDDRIARGFYDATNGTISGGDIVRFGGSLPAAATSVVPN